MDIRFEPHPPLAPGAPMARRADLRAAAAALAGDAVEVRVRRDQDARAALLRDLRETADALALARETRGAIDAVSGRLAGLEGVVEALALLEEPDEEQTAELQALLDEGLVDLDRLVGSARASGRGLVDGGLDGERALHVAAAGVRLAVPDLGARALGLEQLEVDDPRTAEALRAARERVDEVRGGVEEVIERLQLARQRVEQKLEELARGRAPDDASARARDARDALLRGAAHGALVHGLLGADAAATLLTRPS